MNLLGVKAKDLSNGAKVFCAFIALAFNLFYLVSYGRLPGVEEQKSLIYMLSFIILIFSPVDISLIAKNIFQKRTPGGEQ